jgi:hypothetical protein
MQNRQKSSSRNIIARALGLLLLFALIYHQTDSGLPKVNIYHANTDGVASCCCGCNCGADPDSQSSCLNPANFSNIECGCQQTHAREFVLTHKALQEFIIPDSKLVFEPAIVFVRQPANIPGILLEGFFSIVVPPH